MKISKRMKILVILVGPPALALLIGIGGEIVMHLWNWLAPPVFGWHEITFWQALGLLALTRILFGGFGCRGSSRSREWTPEEKERFRQGVRRRFGWGPPPGESAPGAGGEAT
jgi:hypothetical protein